jgi:hypothetical protein
MKWFVTVLVMKCQVGSDPRELWDEQVHLLRASGAEDAFARAQKLGKGEAHSYLNSHGEKVSWNFVGIGELQELLESRIRSGIEVYSTLSRGLKSPRVLRKSELNVFRFQRDRNKTAKELLPKELKPFAPR